MLALAFFVKPGAMSLCFFAPLHRKPGTVVLAIPIFALL
jgi:hypothetical protein